MAFLSIGETSPIAGEIRMPLDAFVTELSREGRPSRYRSASTPELDLRSCDEVDV
jgi:hypothetical protein